MNRSDGEIDRLLARGGLGGAAREQILDDILGTARETDRRPRRRLWVGGAVALSAAAALALVVWPRSDSQFRTKGPAAGRAVLDVGCPPASLTACPVGSTLVFSVLGAEVPGHLQAWAERQGGDRIWYLSAETQTAALAPGAGTQPARSGVRIGAEHAPGPYRIHLVFSTTPLPRADLLAGSVPAIVARATFDLTVVE